MEDIPEHSKKCISNADKRLMKCNKHLKEIQKNPEKFSDDEISEMLEECRNSIRNSRQLFRMII